MRYRLMIIAWIIAEKGKNCKQTLLILSQVFFCNAGDKW